MYSHEFYLSLPATMCKLVHTFLYMCMHTQVSMSLYFLACGCTLGCSRVKLASTCTSTHACTSYRHVQSCTCNFLFSSAKSWERLWEWGERWKGEGSSHPPRQHQQTWSLMLLVFAWDPAGHRRVCLFSLSGIDLLANLLNITSGKKSIQQLSLIQEKD